MVLGWVGLIDDDHFSLSHLSSYLYHNTFMRKESLRGVKACGNKIFSRSALRPRQNLTEGKILLKGLWAGSSRRPERKVPGTKRETGTPPFSHSARTLVIFLNQPGRVSL